MSYPLIKYDENCINTKCNKKNKCEYCGMNVSNLIVIQNPVCTTACELCATVIFYDRNNMYRTILLQSNLSQKDVIVLTVNYYKKHGTIPLPCQLDPNVTRLDMSVVQLKFLMCDEKVKKFVDSKNIVSFFNIDYSLETVIPRNAFLPISNNGTNILNSNTYWKEIEKLDIYKISETVFMKEILNKNHNNKNINDIIEISKKNLIKKIAISRDKYKKHHS